MTVRVKDEGIGRTRLSSKNQITVPVAVLRRVHLQAGDVVQVEVVGDGEFRVVRAVDPLERHLGGLTDVYADFELDDLRAEWDR